MIPAPTPVIPMATAIKKPRAISMVLLAGDMDAAFQLLAGPSARTYVLGIGRKRCAGSASYAGVALVIKRKDRDVPPLQVSPHVGVGPIRKRAYFQQLLSGWKAKMIDRLQIGSSRRVLATQSGEPDAVVVESSKERFDFPHSAATVRGVLIQDSKLRLLLRHCLFGRKVDQVE